MATCQRFAFREARDQTIASHSLVFVLWHLKLKSRLRLVIKATQNHIRIFVWGLPRGFFFGSQDGYRRPQLFWLYCYTGVLHVDHFPTALTYRSPMSTPPSLSERLPSTCGREATSGLPGLTYITLPRQHKLVRCLEAHGDATWKRPPSQG
jgi:hypothetical protein